MPAESSIYISGYEPALDGLRALAVTSVVATHVSPRLFPGGWIGVDLFFVLSGYLITTLLMREIARSGSIQLKNFYMRRLLRLAPAFGTVLAFVAVTSLAFSSNLTDSLHSVLISSLYMMNWNMALGWFPYGQLEHTWSLATEEQFYLLWPLALLFICRRQPLRWIGAAIVAVIMWRICLVFSGASTNRIYFGFDTRADSLLIGCGLALLRPNLQIARALIVIPASAMIIIITKFDDKSEIILTVGFPLVSLMSAWLILGALQQGRFQRVLSTRPFVYTGRISYGWYLWHFPILGLSLKVGFLQSPSAKIALAALAYVAAMCSYRCIEQPFLKLKSRFAPVGTVSESVRDTFASTRRSASEVAAGSISVPRLG